MSGNEGWTPAVTVFFLSTDIFVLDHPRSMRAYVLLVFYFYIFLVISIRPIISTPNGPIFTKFAELVELWPQMNDLKLFFSIP